jgi:tetratricopeptide (TPR) repeat protein
MTQKRPAVASLAVTPELLLRKATLARTSVTRAKYAQRGLAHDAPLDHTTRVLLLRQLYLSHMEGRRFADALAVAEQMLGTSVMPDVARQDAARACLGLGDREKAIEHLRIGSRVSPPARRAFHLWTLGSVLYLEGRYTDACGALSRAARWGTRDKPLYLAGLGLAKLGAGERVTDLAELREPGRAARAPVRRAVRPGLRPVRAGRAVHGARRLRRGGALLASLPRARHGRPSSAASLAFR